MRWGYVMKRRIIRVSAALAVFISAMLISADIAVPKFILFVISYAIAGYDVLFKAVRNILHGQVFDENFLMAIASLGAFFIGEYPEGVAVMIFYQVGEIFQNYAVDRSRQSISSLMEIRPDYANVIRSGKTEKCDPYDVAVGDTIIIRPGERVPLDAVVLSGNSMIDTSALTGESVPRDVCAGDELLSGCININELITARVTKEYSESTIQKILDLVENASEKKSTQESFITRFSRIYTPAVVAAALLLSVIPPLFIAGQQFSDWLYRALLFLVVSCPCALVISVPLGFFSGIGGASKLGILVKGGNYLEALSKVDTFVFDKTGTLTRGVFKVKHIYEDGFPKKDVLRFAAYAENYSSHPISLSLKSAYGEKIDETLISDVEEIAGHGVSAQVGGVRVLAGNMKLMKKFGIEAKETDEAGTIVHVAADERYAGYIVIADEIKADAKEGILALKASGVKRTVMLTGDIRAAAESVAREVGVDEVYSELLPGEKVNHVEKLQKEGNGGKIAFVGDGINDAPVLARADVGIAMGGLGSDAAIEAADIVIMDDKPSKLAVAVNISKRTIRIVKQNIVFALSVKGAVLLLGALGIATMWEAVFADVGVSVIAILNAMRVLNVGSSKKSQDGIDIEESARYNLQQIE